MRGIKSGVISIIAIGLLAGPAVGVGAQDADPPTRFTARFVPSSSVRSGTAETVGDHVAQRGWAWAPLIEDMSDPRLDGRLTYSSNVDLYTGADGEVSLGTATYRIETDDGAWEGSTPFLDADDSPTSTVVLAGSGAYEGLYAVMGTDWDAIVGFIFAAPPPEAPTAP